MKTKTEPASVRFDIETFNMIAQETGFTTPQKQLNYLQRIWRQSRIGVTVPGWETYKRIVNKEPKTDTEKQDDPLVALFRNL